MTSVTLASGAVNSSADLALKVNGTTKALSFNTSGALGVGSTPSYGTSGQVLTSAGTGAAPTWATASSGASAATPTVLGTVYGKMTTSGGTPYLTALGYNAAVATTGIFNTAVGYLALTTNTTGANNAACGVGALQLTTTGAQNTAFGTSAGISNTTGSYNTFIGSENTGFPTGSNQIVIGSNVSSQNSSNCVTIGSVSGYIYNNYTVNATWTQVSDGTLKNIVGPDTLGLSFINRLNPIKYTWKAQNELPTTHPHYKETNYRDTTTVIHGFIAQDIKAALDAENCSTFNGWDEGPDGVQAISREMFISPLVKAVQELSAQVETIKAEFAAYVATHP
jgi:hypothetical protein